MDITNKVAYLISCTHQTYCQGWENCTEDFLVYAESYERACTILEENLNHVVGFRNKTLK